MIVSPAVYPHFIEIASSRGLYAIAELLVMFSNVNILLLAGHCAEQAQETVASRASYTLCLKKVPTFKLSVTLSNVNQFSKFSTVGKRTKFATKPIRHYTFHFRHVATQSWEIKNAHFLQIFSAYGRKCKQIAF